MTYQEYEQVVEGEAKRNAEIAKAMLANGIDVSVIANCTNLSIEQINNI